MGLAFLYPGQGAQRVAMVREFWEAFPQETEEHFRVANDICQVDLLNLCLNGPQEELNLTYNAQPAILTTSFLIFDLLLKEGVPEPEVVAGHSLGEYSALVCAGCFSFPEAVYLVRKRGEIMQAAVPPDEGAMVAIIGLSLSQVEELVEEVSPQGKVEIANLNSSDQIVLSLERKILDLVLEKTKQKGSKKAIPLEVSAPFHSSFMKPAQEQFRIVLQGVNFQKPRYRYLSNVTGDWVDYPQDIRELLVEQMTSSVQWKKIMDRLYQADYRSFVEVGPGSVLGKLFKREYREVTVYRTDSIASFEIIKRKAG
ncbi:MAG: [acyl-carrier-protein] S-malonyltransferase [Candidatus Atribacteria bacterium]|nr:[acyl-carrier-protein] S-malonyltransferase [Candidatus Atribacteria bacterium]